jgi:methionyl-tRNA formyltransferase
MSEHELVCVIGDEKVQDTAGRAGVGAWLMGNPRQNVAPILRPTQPDVVVAAHWTRYVSSEARQFGSGVIGIHPSLLPRHRGINAIEWTIRERDPIAGSTAYWMDDGMDTGNIIVQEWCHVHPTWSAKDLWREQLFGLGQQVLRRALSRIEHREAGAVVGRKQDIRFATLAPSIKPEDGKIREEAGDLVIGPTEAKQ